MKLPYRQLQRALETFEPPRPRETTFGIAARFFAHSNLLSSQPLHKYLFGYATTELASRLPGGLVVLQRRMPWVWDRPEKILMGHTVWPLFRIFEPSKAAANRVSDLLLHAKKSPGQQLRRLFELDVGEVWEKRFLPRYCMECALDDMRASKLPTWYRDHQIPGINWCARHGSDLYDYCVGCGDTMFRHGYVLPPHHRGCRDKALWQLGINRPGRARFPRPGRHTAKPSDNYERRELRMSRFAIAMMEMDLPPILSSRWAEAIRIGVSQKGLFSSLYRIRKGDLVKGILGDMLVTPEISAIRDLARPSDRKTVFSELSPKKKLIITSLIFESVDDFVATLNSI